MATQFVPVKDTQQVDALFAQSQDAPVVVFKHDPYCPISANAHRQLSRIAGDIPTIDVAHDQAIASAITERTGITHESPQVIVLRGGKPVWSASLYDITTDAVQQAMGQ